MKIRNFIVYVCVSLVVACGGVSEEDREKLEDAQVDLEQLADQIIITYPANDAVVSQSVITVRADIPSAAEAQTVELYVDGIPVAKDTDGAPWEIEWPAYYWSDGGRHTLLLKTTTAAGNEVRNNQQFSVTVSGAHEALSISDGLAGAELVDTGSVEVDFEPFVNATGYEVALMGSDQEPVSSDGESAVIDGLEVGDSSVAYRAIWDITASTTLVGPWSEAVSFSVLTPELPVLNEPVITAGDNGLYVVDFSWEELAGANTYEIVAVSMLDSTSVYRVTSGTSHAELELPLGSYEWTLTRTNAFGHSAGETNSVLMELGVFKKQFGGSSDDRAEQFIALSDGGYIIRASTKSTELNDQIDSSGDDWVFKVDAQGEMEWQTFLIGGGRDRLSDITELTDGSFIAVGNDWSTDQAYAVKMSADGEVEWEQYYRPDTVTDRYDFMDVTQVGEVIYVSAAEWGPGSCSSCTQRVNYYLHTLDPSTGIVQAMDEIPVISGMEIDSVSELKTTGEQLLIAGTVIPEDAGEYDYFEAGAFWMRVDGDMNVLDSWNNAEQYLHQNLGDVVELSSGNYALVGQSSMGGYALTITSPNGTTVRDYSDTYGDLFYSSGSSIGSDDQDRVYLPLTDYSLSADPVVVYPVGGFSNDKYIHQELGEYASPVGVIVNSVSTYTFLVNQGQNEYRNQDILLIQSVRN